MDDESRGGRVPVQRADLLQSSNLHVNPTMTRINYARWLLRVLTWDTLLPVGISILPRAINLVLPNQPRVIDFASVIAPIVAFFLRLREGTANFLEPVFGVGTGLAGFRFLLRDFSFGSGRRFADFMACTAKRRAKHTARRLDDTHRTSRRFYLTGMVIAMYPGRSPATTRSWSHGER